MSKSMKGGREAGITITSRITREAGGRDYDGEAGEAGVFEEKAAESAKGWGGEGGMGRGEGEALRGEADAPSARARYR